MTADTTAPTAPGGLGGSVIGSTVNLTWTGSTDDVGVIRYNVHRGTSAGFTPTAGNRIAQPTGTSYSDPGSRAARTTTRSPPRTPPATSAAPSNESPQTLPTERRRRRRAASARWPRAARSTCPGRPRPTTSASLRYNVHRGATSRLHALARQPDRTADGHELRRSGSGAGHLLLQGHGRGRRRQRRPGLEHGERDGPRHRRTQRTGRADRRRQRGPGTRSAGPPRATTSASSATTCTARRPPALRRAPATGSRSPPGRATPTPGSPPAPTTTGSPPRTRPATSAARPARHRRSSRSAPAVGLVAAYGFDEGLGTTIADQSGTGNTGTVSGADVDDRGQVRQRAQLRRRQRPRHRRRRQQPRPDDTA